VKNRKNFVEKSFKLEKFGYLKYPHVLTSRVAIGHNIKGNLGNV
jgi:hypothetical protein